MLFFLWFLVTVQAHVASQKREVDPEWVNSPTNFYRRSHHSSIILGDYLYFDGGVVQFEENGNVKALPVNSTYSIGLSSSWNPKDVVINRFDKGDFTVFNAENLWLSTDNQSFFAFNGDIGSENTFQAPPGSPQLWRFTPDGNGGGRWSLFSVAPAPLIQSVWASVATANGSAYLLGGIQSPHSTSAFNYDASIFSSDGIVSYDMVTQSWKNNSITDSYPSGWLFDTQLSHMTGIGNEPLLLAIGGQTYPPSPILGPATLVDFSTVAIYNTVTNEWSNQSTTGDIPGPRGATCSVGIQGDEGTFEMFLYGGWFGASPEVQSQANTDRGRTVYVLSIPSFTWHSVYDDTQTARAFHTCSIRNRQMLVNGGIQPNVASNVEGPDPWPQGLGIFDLVDLTWKSSYDSAGAPYVTPQKIKDYIAANGQYPEAWTNDLLPQWINGRASLGNTTTGANSTSSSSPIPAPASSKSPSNTGSIVGGVVGGVGGALLLALVAWFVLRRRRRARVETAQHEQQEFKKPELEDSQMLSRKDAVHEKSGDEAADHRRELHGRPLHEMEGSAGEHELPLTSGR